MIDFREIRALLIRDIRALAKQLVPDGRANGKYWIGRNPTRADRHGGSFWVLLQGPATGAFRDEAGVRGVDEGDVVRLVQYCLGHADLKETRAWCLRFLGISDGPAGERRTLTDEEIAARDAARAAEREKQEREEAATRAKAAKGAFGLWLNAEELTAARFPGSVVDRYLRSRAIDLVANLLDRGKPLPGALRFYPNHDYRTADGELIALPCMIALMSGPDGRPRAVHRTWLRRDGKGKADLPNPRENKPRKIWPAGWQGSVIRIHKGEGLLSPEQAAEKGRSLPLIITEGIEDGLACALAMPGRRVWAAGTLGNLGHVPVNHPCVSSITVCRDNDWDKPQAVESFEKGLAALKAHGKPVHVARSPRGKDMNDLLKGETI